ncbi:response regulator transcription factor [Paenibacillus ehimensis]|uniref:Response regulator transcription factor n=1 Tax=Paenibacillus ehimensis TaxID=79264 RepID=A0ABT8V3R7_9BACL|nr:response regulator transcription factor [Paenibacillus ehimensis]MDO3676064.1 response regulator transcription factor [Paenibacillus ehimensis]
MEQANSVLVADDDPDIRDIIQIYLRNEGYRVLEAEDGVEALELAKREKLDLIILDIMMPRMDGIRACMKIREMSEVPIIMLSAKGEDLDKITGLSTGADDYVVKPFNPLELVARVKACLRRQHMIGKKAERGRMEVGDLVVDPARHLVTVRGKKVNLTPIEFAILALLAKNRGQVFSVDAIYEHVWKEGAFHSDNTVMVHIRNLREKLEDIPREPRYIKTVWGVGYKIE